jgi:hypothetical protein
MSLMPNDLIRFVAALILSAVAASGHAAQEIFTFHITEPSIVGYAPSDTRSQSDEGSIEGVAHTRFALEDTSACLGQGMVKFELVFADQIIVVDGNQKFTLQVDKLGQGFGAVLMEPGREPKVVFAEEGPSTLQYLVPDAASVYWGEPRCKQDG